MKIICLGREILICDAYVDVGRYIGNDPIGYKCSLEASEKSREGYDLCSWCAAHLDRVTFTPFLKEETNETRQTPPQLMIPAPRFRIGDEVRSCYQSPFEHPFLLEPGPAPRVTGRAFRLAIESDEPNNLDKAVHYGYWIYQLGKNDSCCGSYSYREEELYSWSEKDRERYVLSGGNR